MTIDPSFLTRDLGTLDKCDDDDTFAILVVVLHIAVVEWLELDCDCDCGTCAGGVERY